MQTHGTLDSSHNKSQAGSGSNSTTTMNASAREIESKKIGTTGTAGPAKDVGVTGYNYGQVGHISRNCTNRDLKKMLLEQALVGKDAPKAKSGCECKDKKRGGARTR